MAYNTEWIQRVRAAKGNTANTNPNAGKTHTRTPSTRSPYTTTTKSIHARGGGDVRRKVMASGGPRKATIAEKQKYASRATYTPRSTAISTPSKVYAAMGVQTNAHSSEWDTLPKAVFNGNKLYQHPANNYIYIIGSSGQVAQYQPNHRRLYAQVGSGKAQASDYPDWFDDDTIEYLENIGGITDDQYLSI